MAPASDESSWNSNGLTNVGVFMTWVVVALFGFGMGQCQAHASAAVTTTTTTTTTEYVVPAPTPETSPPPPPLPRRRGVCANDVLIQSYLDTFGRAEYGGNPDNIPPENVDGAAYDALDLYIGCMTAPFTDSEPNRFYSGP